MARIATCNRCALEFYDSSMERTTCNRCQAYQKERASKIGKWKRIINTDHIKGKFRDRYRFRIISMHWREGLSISEIADILDFTEDRTKFEIEIIKQDAS